MAHPFRRWPVESPTSNCCCTYHTAAEPCKYRCFTYNAPLSTTRVGFSAAVWKCECFVGEPGIPEGDTCVMRKQGCPSSCPKPVTHSFYCMGAFVSAIALQKRSTHTRRNLERHRTRRPDATVPKSRCMRRVGLPPAITTVFSSLVQVVAVVSAVCVSSSRQRTKKGSSPPSLRRLGQSTKTEELLLSVFICQFPPLP